MMYVKKGDKVYVMPILRMPGNIGIGILGKGCVEWSFWPIAKVGVFDIGNRYFFWWQLTKRDW